VIPSQPGGIEHDRGGDKESLIVGMQFIHSGQLFLVTTGGVIVAVDVAKSTVSLRIPSKIS